MKCAGHNLASSPRRRGVAAVLAMMYLIIMSSLALGIYYSQSTSVSVADNEQYLHLSNSAAEGGLQFARAQLSQISLPAGNWPGGGLSAILNSSPFAALSNTANVNGHNPVIANSTLYIPGTSNGAPNWISLDQNSDQFYVTLQIASGNQLQVNSYGRHSTGGAYAISRQMQITFAPNQQQSAVFNYGLVSNGELNFNGKVILNGTNNAAIGSALSFGNPAINVNNSSSFSGDFSYTNSGAVNRYGNLTLDGYLPSSGSYSQHVHAGVSATLPTIDTSAYLTALQAPSAGAVTVTTGSAQVNPNTATTLTNLILSSGSYTFNKPLTINGILYLKNGASVQFNNNTTVNGCIVQDNAAVGGSVIFDGPVTENSITTLNGLQFSSEQSLTNAFLITPKAAVTLNNNVSAAGSMIASSFQFNGSITATLNGTIMSMSSAPFTFNNSATINITTTSAAAPSGVSGGNWTFSASPGSYQEVQ